MQIASSRKALAMALVCWFMLVPSARTQILANPLYDQGMEAFNARQYGRSQQIFRQCLAYEKDPANMYMYALSCQKLGQNTEAINMYKQIMGKFPDSPACTRAQSAMAMLAPSYLKAWMSKQGGSIGKGVPDGGQGVAPDLFKFERYLPPHDLWHFQRLNGRMVVDAGIAHIKFKAEIDPKSEYSYIGVNHFRDGGMEMTDVKDEDRVINRCDIDVANIHRQMFPLHLVNHKDGPPVLGQDFLKNYATKIDNKAQTIYLQRIASLPALNTKRENATYDYFEVPFRREGMPQVQNMVTGGTPGYNNLGMIIINVFVDNVTVPMLFAGSDITQFSTEQIRNINPAYLEDANMQEEGTSGMVSTFSGVIKIKFMRLGKIDRRGVPARIIENANARYQAYRWGDNPYAKLGTEFYAGWTTKIDEKRLVIKFIREIPKDLGPGLGQPQH